MKFDILTLFPDMFTNVLSDSIIGRAQKKGIVEFNFTNIRDFSGNKHNRVDDYPYGGGQGMVMMPQCIYNAYKSVAEKCQNKPHTVYLSPKGAVFNQDKAAKLSKMEHIVLLCGHYEGVDQRVIDEIADEEISVGDYVLTGGELPAMVVIDAVCRMIDGVLSCEESFSDESHFSGLLEYPQYTRPPEFMGKKVPDVLLSGDHKKINEWRRQKALEETRLKRPDMFEKYKQEHKNENL